MKQPIDIHADIDEGSEIDDITYCTINSIPGVRSSALRTSLRRCGFGKFSRGSRPGLAISSKMSCNVLIPTFKLFAILSRLWFCLNVLTDKIKFFVSLLMRETTNVIIFLQRVTFRMNAGRVKGFVLLRTRKTCALFKTFGSQGGNVFKHSLFLKEPFTSR